MMPVDIRGTKLVIDDMLKKLGGQPLEPPEAETQAEYTLLYVACCRFFGSAQKIKLRWDRYTPPAATPQNLRPQSLGDWRVRTHSGETFRTYYVCDPEDPSDDSPALYIDVSIKEGYFGRDSLVVVWLFDGVEDEERFSEEDRRRAYRLGLTTPDDETIMCYRAEGLERANFDVTEDDLRWLDRVNSYFVKTFSGDQESLVRFACLSENLFGIYIGEDWTRRHIWKGMLSDARGKTFGRFGIIDHLVSTKHVIRVVALAEMLFNFQGVPNIRQRVRALKTEDIESVLGELECAQILVASGTKISFVVPTGVRGGSYDLDAYLADGTLVACEIKTKFESTVFGEETVKNSLKKACDQLPKDRATAILMKVPEHWLDQIDMQELLEKVVKDTFRMRSQLSAVFFYWERWTERGKGVVQNTTIDRHVNPDAKFTHSELEFLVNPPLTNYHRFFQIVGIPGMSFSSEQFVPRTYLKNDSSD